ncbi:uncharacterized protein VNE69_12003 [Vairimorpha necatrix]|uniref:Ubiquitin-like domain-containing protein n=1 Tax=Vairimorpha necatrix TaxID=6039 RepID=A0AAX4JGJ3_9MICR
MKKIEDRDYLLFDHSKRYMTISISKDQDFYGDNSDAFIEVTLCFDIKNNYEIDFIINCGNKSLNQIITELEEKIQSFISFPYNKEFVLFYSEYQLGDSISLDGTITMENVIETIKKINSQRKINKKGREIYYENICIESGYFEDIIKEISENKVNVEHAIKYYDYVPNYFLFRIDIENKSFLFQFYIEEIDYENDIKMNLENKYDEKILIKLLERYNLSYEYLFDTPFIVVPINCIPNGIEIIHEDIIFKMEIETDAVVFSQNSKIYIYSIRDDVQEFFFIDEQCLMEFRKFIEIASRINDENIKKAIGIFYRLLKIENFVNFILEILLNRPISAIKIILAHNLLYYNIIDEPELKVVISNEKHNNIRKTEVVNKILSKIHTFYYNEFFVVKICLLLETEKYIVRNNLENDVFCKNLELIGNLIRLKNSKNDFEMIDKKDNFNLIGILEEMVSVHIVHFKTYKKKVLTYICKTLSLFTGLNTNFIDYFDKKHYAKIVIYEVIESFGLNKNKVEKCNKVVRKKLIENTQEDIKLEVERKNKEAEFNKILQILKKNSLENELKKRKKEALNSDTVALFNKDIINEFANELISDGIRLIENTFLSKIINKGINEQIINEYKEELKENLIKEIKINIKKNIKKKSKISLMKITVELFKSEVKNLNFLRKNQEKILHDIINLIQEVSILEFFNREFGKNLHNILIKMLKNQNKL